MPDERTILIVEDNALNAEILTKILRDSYRILLAKNGAEGFEVLQEQQGNIALILLDLEMPVMDGYQFLQAIRDEGTHIDIPIIVTTVGDTDETQLRCLDLGASDFVPKPYNPKIVRKRVESLIRLRETSIMLGKVVRDEVTGLLNLESFTAYVQQTLQNNPSGKYDMVCLEVESYRLLHSRYGAQKCDALMHRLAQGVAGTLSPKMLMGRVDSDVIAIFLEHASFEKHQQFMKQCIAGMQPFQTAIPNVQVNCGVYMDVDRSLAVSSMISNAVTSIEPIRNRYDKHLAKFDSALRDRQASERMIINDAMQAIKEEQFIVHLQPKVDARDSRIVGAEALIRWQHPKLGFLSPTQFIPLFETNGCVYEVDKHVLRLVCAYLRRCLDEGKPVVPISVNISQMDFDQVNIADVLEDIVDSFDVPHKLICFEITESAEASDRLKKADAAASLSSKGFLIELDDFGSGYSTLLTLGELPIDVMKVDTGLIENMFDAKFNSILKGVLYTAADLDYLVVAEGVESRAQADALKAMCEDHLRLVFQGFMYYQPMPMDEFDAALQESLQA